GQTKKGDPLRSRKLMALAAAAVLALAVAACGSSSSSSGGGGGGGTINGAGSTFAAPICQQFGSTLKGQGVTVNYQPAGSGAGVARPAGACGSSSSSSGGGGGGGTINGAGSTFAAPIYQQFGSTLKGQGVTVNYQPVGSGAGVAQFAAGTVDFGASDPALAPA